MPSAQHNIIIRKENLYMKLVTDLLYRPGDTVGSCVEDVRNDTRIFND